MASTEPIRKSNLPTTPPPEFEFHTVLGGRPDNAGCMLVPGDTGPVVVRRRVTYGDWEPVRPDHWANEPTPEQDVCRPVAVDGETIRVRGQGELTAEGKEALAALMRVAKAKLVAEAPDQAGVLQKRLRLAHKARRAKEHQLDDIRRALCDIGFMDDDDPYSHADLADVIRQNGQALLEGSAAKEANADTVRQYERAAWDATQHVLELKATIERVRAFATRLEEFSENALREDDRKLYAVLARDIRARCEPDKEPTALVREQKERPTHPDGTPYSYYEITAEGWGYCVGCHMWSTATPQRPHQCPETHISGPTTGGA